MDETVSVDLWPLRAPLPIHQIINIYTCMCVCVCVCVCVGETERSWSIDVMTLTAENRRTGRKTCPSAQLLLPYVKLAAMNSPTACIVARTVHTEVWCRDELGLYRDAAAEKLRRYHCTCTESLASVILWHRRTQSTSRTIKPNTRNVSVQLLHVPSNPSSGSCNMIAACLSSRKTDTAPKVQAL
jgi:hypothetical protein